MRSARPPPSTAATAAFLRGAPPRAPPPPPPAAAAAPPTPPAARNPAVAGPTVVRLREDGAEGAAAAARVTVKSARSWASVSRMRAVMSCGWRRAFVKILGGGKLPVLVGQPWREGGGLEVGDCLGAGGDLVEVGVYEGEDRHGGDWNWFLREGFDSVVALIAPE
jgi:hypothetical protein